MTGVTGNCDWCRDAYQFTYTDYPGQENFCDRCLQAIAGNERIPKLFADMWRFLNRPAVMRFVSNVSWELMLSYRTYDYAYQAASAVRKGKDKGIGFYEEAADAAASAGHAAQLVKIADKRNLDMRRSGPLDSARSVRLWRHSVIGAVKSLEEAVGQAEGLAIELARAEESKK
jgi:hypothetical protein